MWFIFKAALVSLCMHDNGVRKKNCLHICSDFRPLLNCLCSCVKKKNKNSEVFLFWKALSGGSLSAEEARDASAGRRSRDNVKLCTLSSFS